MLTVKEPMQFLSTQLVKEPRCGNRPKISNPTAAARFLRRHLPMDFEREVFGVICLSPRGQINHSEILSVGGVECAMIDPQAVFRVALLSASPCVIVFHTHPTTGSAQPSEKDIEMTKKLILAGSHIGVKVLDHIIISGKKWTSIATIFREECERKEKEEEENEHNEMDKYVESGN